jgi:hypothetical protein
LVTGVIDSEFVVKGLRRSIYDHEPLRLTLSRQLDLPEIESVTVDREAVDARACRDCSLKERFSSTNPKRFPNLSDA